ncbi:TonB-dependent receptor plug domain-containing protein [Porphyromonas macacae]|uniref:TonB-dependent receptor plug domain-containing protein n=1 Tax=Porphyromonas macacae TaxID=28115 RepID=UPI0006843EDC|nr:Plug domain-containing protein [Porphyromonas macacae]
MKRIYTLFFGLFMFLLTLPFRVYAFKYVDHEPADSLITHELEEVEVIGSSFIMRQAGTLNKMPGTYSLITPLQIEQFNIHSITDLSSVVPNFYMPDYGSRLTSAIYVRGIGARSSDQTIGLYVDGVPVMNKAGFNMEMQGLQAIEVLNGPQGTLYGRNAWVVS